MLVKHPQCLQLLYFLGVLLLCISCQNSSSKKTPSSKEDTLATNIIADTPKTQVATIPIPDFDTTKWMDILFLDSSIIVDMKYATTDNFAETKLYPCSRCFLRPEVAQSILKAQKVLQKKGLGLKLLDCYRPRPVQQDLWEKFPNPSYVTPPKVGSMHNRGSAVDLTIVKNNGEELDMGTPFDFFGKKAHHDYTNLPEVVLQNRALLKEVMTQFDMRPIRTEWWHYYFKTGKKYKLADMVWKCE